MRRRFPTGRVDPDETQGDVSTRATRRSRAARLAWLAPVAGPAAIILAAGIALVRTWGTWPDVIVDFGREIYLPWRIARGETLYVDLAHFSGPLSAYVNALWFRLFGPSLLTLALASIAIAAVFVTLLYGLLVRISSRLAATAACLTFVALFACAGYTRIGNYNWVCPYSTELTHGATLVVAALWCLDRYHRTQRVAWMAGLGVAMGLAILTKAEVVFASVLAGAVGVVLTLVVERPTAGRAAGILAIVTGAAAVPLFVVGAYFATVMPLAEVLRWPLGHWRAALVPQFRAFGFYRESMGTDEVTSNLYALGIAALGYGAVLAVAVAGAFVLRRVHRALPAVVVGTFLVTAAALDRVVSLDGWVREAPRPLPLFMGILSVAAVVEVVRRRSNRERALEAVRVAALATFALVLLAKLAVNARLYHYGFVLAAPATIVLVVAVVEWLPAAVGRLGGRAAIVRAVTLGALVAAVMPQVAFMQKLVDTKVHIVGSGTDRFRADSRGVAMAALLDEVRTRLGPTQTLVLLPEGVLVNYLTRRVNPTPYFVFDELTYALWGEERMVQALEAAGPDYVAFVDRGGSGTKPRFGRSSGVALHRWATTHYRPVWQRGVPFGDGSGASVALLRRDG